MDLVTLARTLPEMSITIRLRDLIDANKELVRNVRAEFEREQKLQKKQYGDYLIQKEEARQMLGAPDPSTMYRWQKAGYLTPVKIGVKVFYQQKEVTKLIESNKVKRTKQ